VDGREAAPRYKDGLLHQLSAFLFDWLPSVVYRVVIGRRVVAFPSAAMTVRSNFVVNNSTALMASHLN
jgi:hypothetical protein